jgi:predicted O-methyltransferase YrrM
VDLESTWTEPRADCPHPERYHAPDPDTTETEVTTLVAAFVTALQPDVVVETGSAFGFTSQAIGEALHANGQGMLYTYEVDRDRARDTLNRVAGLPVIVAQRPSLAGIADLIGIGHEKRVRFAFLDSLLELRVPELQAIRPLLAPGAIVGVHDCGEPEHTKYGAFSREVAVAAMKLGFNRISLPTPRGVTFLQWTRGY